MGYLLVVESRKKTSFSVAMDMYTVTNTGDFFQSKPSLLQEISLSVKIIRKFREILSQNFGVS